MAREPEKDRVRKWGERITAADKIYDTWEARFRCKQAYDYYEGFQWYGRAEPGAGERGPYTINLCFPTIEIQLPSLLFFNPKIVASPRPAHADDPGSLAPERAKLAEDTVQTFVDDPAVHFKLNTLLALRAAEFRFGVVEVGYSADWLDNPNADKPILNEDTGEPLRGDGDTPVPTPTKVPRPGSERIYVTHIPPEHFRVSLSGRQVLSENDWVGYKQWFYLEDIKANPLYKNTAKLTPGGTVKDGASTSEADDERHRGMVCVWKVWDLRTKTKIVLVEGHEKFLLEEPFTYLPLSTLKFFERADGWYPIPPTANWLDPQDEINEIRESRKVHRTRFLRRYTVKKGAIDQAELDKLETGEDGAYAFVNQDNAILPVPDAPMGADTDKALAESRDDFMQITGVGAEARGQAESETATQANIIDVHAKIRESSSRSLVGAWLGDIARLMLLCVSEKMQLPFWIQIHQDPFAGDARGAQQTAVEWQQLNAQALQNLSVDISVDVSSLSPVSEQQQLQGWTQILALITNPQFAMLFSLSEPILKKTLKMFGITNPAEVKEIQKVMQVMVMAQMSQAAQPGTGPGATATAGGASQPPAGLPAAGAGIQ